MKGPYIAPRMAQKG